MSDRFRRALRKRGIRTFAKWHCVGLPSARLARNFRAGFAIAGLADVEVFRCDGWHYVKYPAQQAYESVWAGFVCNYRGGYFLTDDPRASMRGPRRVPQSLESSERSK